MSSDTVFANARIVTRTGVLDGSLRIADGKIAAIDAGPGGGRDMEGDYLLPGLVDIHTDNLEKHLEPRPGVTWPGLAAIVAHDRQIAAAGITTVFDSLYVGFDGASSGRREALDVATGALAEAAEGRILISDHMLHLRCELGAPDVVDDLTEALRQPRVRLVSVMDHTPGQRQWRNLDHWRQFHSKRYSREELDATIHERLAAQQLHAEGNRRRIVALCRERGLPLASHDDTTPDHVLEGVGDGVRISEFPTTFEAARCAHEHGLATVMGAPNIVIGGSHSGNVAAHDLATEGLLDGLASDYVPISMIQAIFVLHRKWDVPLSEAVAMASANPAEMVGLTDRGRLEAGRRADLARVRMVGGVAVVREVWIRGERVM